jgi:hypothetical protein
MIRPVMAGNKTWESTGSFFRPGIQVRNYPVWKIFWTPNGYQLLHDETTIRYFRYLRDAKRYACDCIEQSNWQRG